MINPDSITEKLLFTTVRIQSSTTTSTGTGTGFFFKHKIDEDKTLPLVVTNKHVVRDASSGNFLLHEAETVDEKFQPSGKFIPVTLDKFEQRWFGHPDDEVDLCGMPIKPLMDHSRKTGNEVFRFALDASMIKSDDDMADELTAVEEVVMVGYPIGLWDEENNLPIIRRGTTAFHPAIDFNGKPLTVIDAACFPGSSGSPVLVADEGPYTEKKGNHGLVFSRGRTIFMGVLSSSPVYTAEGRIVVKNVPTVAQVTAEVGQMIHLGYIIKAKEVLNLGDHILKSLGSQGLI